MFLAAVLFTALGSYIGTFIEDMRGFQLIMGFIVMPTFFLSGALFPLTDVPIVMLWIARFDPLSYGVDALRGLLTGAAHFGLAVDLIVLIGVSALLIAFGTRSFARMQV